MVVPLVTASKTSNPSNAPQMADIDASTRRFLIYASGRFRLRLRVPTPEQLP